MTGSCVAFEGDGHGGRSQGTRQWVGIEGKEVTMEKTRNILSKRRSHVVLMAVGTCLGLGGVLASSAAAQGLVRDSDAFPVIGGRYESLNSAMHSTGLFDTEIVSMSLVGNASSSQIFPLGLDNGTWHVDSFFDVFTELSVDGGAPQVESFFDVFFDITVTDVDDRVGLTGLEGELVQMELAGPARLPDGTAVVLRESPTQSSRGPLSITDIGGGLYHIDSFFDVFTELWVDGGSFAPGDVPLQMVLMPEPATLVLLTLGGSAMIRRRRK